MNKISYKIFRQKYNSEHIEQVKVCKYLDALGVFYYSIPNGFKYHGILKMLKKKISAILYKMIEIKIFKEIKEMKTEGMKSGIPDLCICEAKKGYHGLYIEMKKEKGSTTSEEQKEKIKQLNDKGYKAIVCKGFVEAKKVIDEYIK